MIEDVSFVCRNVSFVWNSLEISPRHQPMVPAGASKFKVVQHRLQDRQHICLQFSSVHHFALHLLNQKSLLTNLPEIIAFRFYQSKFNELRLEGLLPRDAARLLLRRAQRPLRWGEVQRPGLQLHRGNSAVSTVYYIIGVNLIYLNIRIIWKIIILSTSYSHGDLQLCESSEGNHMQSIRSFKRQNMNKISGVLRRVRSIEDPSSLVILNKVSNAGPECSRFFQFTFTLQVPLLYL